jgi:DNA-directed RNA polymerase specialized sigma24 family protein
LAGDPDPANRANEALARLSPLLRDHLRARYRLLIHLEQDLVQQTLADLFALLGRRTALPSDDELSALAFTILKRRVADLFRSEARSRAWQELGSEPLQEAESPSAERVARYRRLMALVLSQIGELPPDDQRLLLADVTPGSSNDAFSASERQRLSRLRKQLRTTIQREVGAPLEQYLGGHDG